MFATVPPVRQTWALSGPAGPELDTLVALAVQGGCVAEAIEPQTRYRLQGDEAWLALYAEQVAVLADVGYSLAHEAAPQGITVSTHVAPDRAYRRTVQVHGAGAEMVARAVDRGLHVTCAGSLRWTVTGASATLATWLGVDLSERCGLTAEAVAREDAGLSITLPSRIAVDVVTLPTRKTTSEVKRDQQGDIASTESIEQDA
jgi:hypothetical protein